MRQELEWRCHRLMFHQYFNANAVKNYYAPLQRKKFRDYLQRIKALLADYEQLSI